MHVPVHMLHLRDMGLIQGQNWDFEALVAATAPTTAHDVPARRRARAVHRRAASAPVNPVAIL